MMQTSAAKRTLAKRRLMAVRRRRYRAGRLDGKRCSDCDRPVEHNPSVWRDHDTRAAIRCLDCRNVFCPKCARKHFAPVIRSHEKIMDTIVALALKATRGVDCKQVRKGRRS